MSHFSQLVAEALANAQVGDGAKMHQAGKDRILVNDQGQDYVVLIWPKSMVDITKDVVEAYGDDVMGEAAFDYVVNSLAD